ncbi:DUF6104 family protein [Streptomyces sp. CA-106131]|uniref:DUF6104 family protein n=1 Tax=Streptomyces sp. CA-106131 TaxID=3240045 RepID=UPI003D8B3E4E
MHLTDQAIEELQERRGKETVSMAWLADRLQYFADLNPEFRDPHRPALNLACPARRPRRRMTANE